MQVAGSNTEFCAALDLGDDRAPGRVAFELGWDYAYHGQLCFCEDDEVQRGFSEGQRRFGSKGAKPADRYVRKWLLLRWNAWRRRRVISEAVTPAYLAALDVPFCPLLGIPLTYGTGTDTDWSIDRINNEGAYAPGNLAVLSTKANIAKGSLSFAEVLGVATSKKDTLGLTPIQWLRMVSLMAGPCSVTEDTPKVVPFLLPQLPEVTLVSQHLQWILLEEVRGAPVHIMRPLRKGGLARPDREGFERVIKRVRKRAQSMPPLEDFWLHPTLFETFSAWYSQLQMESALFVRKILRSRADGLPLRNAEERWSVATHGYYATAEQ